MSIEKEIINEYQPIRIVDVVFVAPIMIWASTFKALPPILRLALLGTGIATAFFNGRNYLRIRKQQLKLNKHGF